jgi:hypothetical protein
LNIFSRRGFGVFTGGFGENGVAKRGFLMVNLWWNAGESWPVDGHFLGAKNLS